MNKKNDFPIYTRLENDHPLCYLDSASTSQKPQAVLDAVSHFYTTSNANVGRGVYHLAEEATRLYEDARKIVARFIHAKPHEIIFTKNATEGINLVAAAWARETFKPGDEILVSELEHHSNLVPWQWVAEKTGAVLKYLPVTHEGLLEQNAIDVLITKKTKLVAITHSSNAIGTYVDVHPIIKKAHAVGAKVLIDACQTVPNQKTDLEKMGADFLVFSGHKMLAPTGIGVLYITENMHDQVAPFIKGGGTIQRAQFDKATFARSPHKFEGGTPPIAQAIGLGAAIQYLEKTISWDALSKLQSSLCAQLIEGLSRFDRVRILGPLDQLKKKGHLVSFVIDGIHPHDISAFLDQEGICVRAGHFCAQPLLEKLGVSGAVRASFYLYTSADDVDRLVRGIDKLLKKF